MTLAAAFLFPGFSLDNGDDPAWRKAGRWLVPLGLLLGISYALVFGAAWRLFGEYQFIRFVPPMCVLVADLAFGGHRLLMSGVRAVAGRSRNTSETPVPHPAVLALVLIILAKYVLLLSLPKGLWQPGTSIQPLFQGGPERLGLLLPPTIYRPLILMPIWGRWAMMLSLRIGRVSPGEGPRMKRMAEGTSLGVLVAYSMVCGVVTIMYCSPAARYAAQGVMIVLAVMLAGYLASFILARREGGQTEATLGAAGLSAELMFLMSYIAVASRIFWY